MIHIPKHRTVICIYHNMFQTAHTCIKPQFIAWGILLTLFINLITLLLIIQYAMNTVMIKFKCPTVSYSSANLIIKCDLTLLNVYIKSTLLECMQALSMDNKYFRKCEKFVNFLNINFLQQIKKLHNIAMVIIRDNNQYTVWCDPIFD